MKASVKRGRKSGDCLQWLGDTLRLPPGGARIGQAGRGRGRGREREGKGEREAAVMTTFLVQKEIFVAEENCVEEGVSAVEEWVSCFEEGLSCCTNSSRGRGLR